MRWTIQTRCLLTALALANAGSTAAQTVRVPAIVSIRLAADVESSWLIIHSVDGKPGESSVRPEKSEAATTIGWILEKAADCQEAPTCGVFIRLPATNYYLVTDGYRVYLKALNTNSKLGPLEIAAWSIGSATSSDIYSGKALYGESVRIRPFGIGADLTYSKDGQHELHLTTSGYFERWMIIPTWEIPKYSYKPPVNTPPIHKSAPAPSPASPNLTGAKPTMRSEVVGSAIIVRATNHVGHDVGCRITINYSYSDFGSMKFQNDSRYLIVKSEASDDIVFRIEGSFVDLVSEPLNYTCDP